MPVRALPTGLPHTHQSFPLPMVASVPSPTMGSALGVFSRSSSTDPQRSLWEASSTGAQQMTLLNTGGTAQVPAQPPRFLYIPQQGLQVPVPHALLESSSPGVCDSCSWFGLFPWQPLGKLRIILARLTEPCNFWPFRSKAAHAHPDGRHWPCAVP